MIGLSELHIRRAADTANLCRELSRELPLPTIMQHEKLAVSVGTEGTVFFYEFDGWVTYHALFDIDAQGKVCWVESDMGKSPLVVAQKIDAFFALAFLKTRQCYSRDDENPFFHWCSIDCWLEHNMLPHA